VLRAITRDVSDALERCELTHLARTPIDVARARRQHEAYESLLEDAGCRVTRLPGGDDMADSVFVEDIAVVYDEVAVITRPGAVSRRRETPALAEALAPIRPLCRIEAPATLDGGDVLTVGRSVFVGRTSRTNDAGIRQLRAALTRLGYTVAAVDVTGCLHLKSAVTAIDEKRLVINRAWVDRDAFRGFDLNDIEPTEPFAANVLRIGSRVMMGDAFPRTRTRLEKAGVEIVAIDLSETAKAEGGVTCCSLIFTERTALG
jgi:dimethylargininase